MFTPRKSSGMFERSGACVSKLMGRGRGVAEKLPGGAASSSSSSIKSPGTIANYYLYNLIMRLIRIINLLLYCTYSTYYIHNITRA